ncbi:MAG: hypothetical protein GX111_02520 [Clostridiales bacterium]|nr:hypothetical protein [Clostridiales bacterium]
MEKLFIETNDHKVPISEDMVLKYHLKKGMLSPVSHNRIVDQNGNDQPNKARRDRTYKKQDNIKALESETQENFDLSTSEILDFSQGTDSD